MKNKTDRSFNFSKLKVAVITDKGRNPEGACGGKIM